MLLCAISLTTSRKKARLVAAAGLFIVAAACIAKTGNSLHLCMEESKCPDQCQPCADHTWTNAFHDHDGAADARGAEEARKLFAVLQHSKSLRRRYGNTTWNVTEDLSIVLQYQAYLYGVAGKTQLTDIEIAGKASRAVRSRIEKLRKELPNLFPETRVRKGQDQVKAEKATLEEILKTSQNTRDRDAKLEAASECD